MKILALSLLAACLLVSAAAAQTQTPAASAVSVTPPAIATYNNAELVTEFNVSDQDILGYLRMGMLAFGSSARGSQGELGEIVQAIDLETLANALSDLKYLRLLQFRQGIQDDPKKVLDFYNTSAGDGWHRVLWDVSMPGKAFMVLTKDGIGEVMAVAVTNEKPIEPEKGEAVNPAPAGQRIIVARTVGMVDVEKLGAWAGNAVAKFSQIEARKQKEQEEKAKAEAAKKPAVPVKPTAPKKTPAK